MYEVIFNTHDVVLLMTAYQCILFALLLLTLKREHYIRNVFLAFFLASGLHLLARQHMIRDGVAIMASVDAGIITADVARLGAQTPGSVTLGVCAYSAFG